MGKVMRYQSTAAGLSGECVGHVGVCDVFNHPDSDRFEFFVGTMDDDGRIYTSRMMEKEHCIGYADEAGRIYRLQPDGSSLGVGHVDLEGAVFDHLTEEEHHLIGRVHNCDKMLSACAALLLLLPPAGPAPEAPRETPQAHTEEERRATEERLIARKALEDAEAEEKKKKKKQKTGYGFGMLLLFIFGGGIIATMGVATMLQFAPCVLPAVLLVLIAAESGLYGAFRRDHGAPTPRQVALAQQIYMIRVVIAVAVEIVIIAVHGMFVAGFGVSPFHLLYYACLPLTIWFANTYFKRHTLMRM